MTFVSGDMEYRYNYAKLLGRIKEVYGTQEKFAAALGISRISLNQRLNSKLEFSQMEMNRAMKLLGLDVKELPVYFFQVVEKV